MPMASHSFPGATPYTVSRPNSQILSLPSVSRLDEATGSISYGNINEFDQAQSVVSASPQAACLGLEGEEYVVFLPYGGSVDIDLSGVTDSFSVQWFNPRTGAYHSEGKVLAGGLRRIEAPTEASAHPWENR